MKIVKLLANVAMVSLIASCAETKFVGRPGLTVVSGEAQLPAPRPSDLVTEPRGYLVGPYDRLEISVFGIEELSKAVQVDPTGQFSLPLIGTIPAAGKSTGELAGLIASRLRGSYVRDPRVSVNLTEALSQQFTVDGAVAQPGQFPVVGKMTLMRAIARAGGGTEFAREEYVTVFREVDGKKMAALYDLRAIKQGIYNDPEIYPNDVVSVGESRARRVFKDALQASGLLTAPLIALLQ